MNTIFYATDLAEHMRQVCPHATSMAQHCDAMIIIRHVTQISYLSLVAPSRDR